MSLGLPAIVPLRRPINVPGVASYWYQSGAVWLMSANAAVAGQPVGFTSLATMQQFCSVNGGSMGSAANFVPGTYAVFTPQDFPILVEGHSGFFLFASQQATPFALSFLTNLYAAQANFFPSTPTNWTMPSSVGPLVPWTSAPLAVTGPGGSASVQLACVTISATSDIAKGIATLWG